MRIKVINIYISYGNVRKYTHKEVLEHIENKLPGIFINVEGNYLLLDDIRDNLSLHDNKIIELWLNESDESKQFNIQFRWFRDNSGIVKRTYSSNRY